MSAIVRSYDETLIASLAAGATIVGAAETAGITERTVRRRLDDPAFVARLDEARRAVVTEAMDRLGAATTAAVGTLIRLMSQDQPPHVRLRAALGILEAYHKHRSDQAVVERLATLEAEIAAIKQGRRSA
jgi:hypothetical protein